MLYFIFCIIYLYFFVTHYKLKLCRFCHLVKRMHKTVNCVCCSGRKWRMVGQNVCATFILTATLYMLTNDWRILVKFKLTNRSICIKLKLATTFTAYVYVYKDDVLYMICIVLVGANGVCCTWIFMHARCPIDSNGHVGIIIQSENNQKTDRVNRHV